jgi:NDP-sugar pyrophosphorylase family protein
MRIDYCLILSAGFGTRMRSIGTKLPKPIWPIFEKSILELQIDYARMLGAKKVYVNLHFNHNQILNHFHDKEEYEDVHFLIEEEILDIGGGIHNLASQPEVNYKGRLMALNGDQFVFFDFKKLEQAQSLLNSNKVSLIGVNVNAKFGHSETLLDKESRLTKIIPTAEVDKSRNINTYSGMCFVDLENLTPIEGNTSLWKSVADYKNEKVAMHVLNDYEYWDFGTIDRYWDSMFNVLKKKTQNNPFVNFLINSNGIDLIGLKDTGYFSKSNSINIARNKVQLHDGQILIHGNGNPDNNEKGVFYNELFEPVKFTQNP